MQKPFKDAKYLKLGTFFEKFQNFPKASERAQTHPNASERIGTGPSRSEQVQAGPNTSENFEKLATTSKNCASTSSIFAKLANFFPSPVSSNTMRDLPMREGDLPFGRQRAW